VGPFQFQIRHGTGGAIPGWSVRTGEHSTWRLTLPATTEYIVEVSGDAWPDTTAGPYGFQVFPIDRAPENVSPIVAIGDTVVGESLEPVGDADEFTFEAVEGDSLRLDVHFEIASIDVRVVDLTTDATLTSVRSSGHSAPRSVSLNITPPNTGMYRIVFDTVWSEGGHEGNQGPYWFALVRRN
jgi:hypothetical protein